MNILVIGQCTLHWGRMEFGNIGNYYIVEPFFRELHRVFPDAHVRTTFQMTDEFCAREGVERLPMELYYAWSGGELASATAELELAVRGSTTMPFLREVAGADLVVDFSGDIWGDNADFLGADRFRVGVLKARSAKALGKPVAMIAGSPGPFETPANLAAAHTIYDQFDLVTYREPLSRSVILGYGLSAAEEYDLACPAFLFQPAQAAAVEDLVSPILDWAAGRPLVGMVLCGWNFTVGPFDRWPRDDREYAQFVAALEHALEVTGGVIYLMSHANGFMREPRFEMIHGRDHPIVTQLGHLLQQRGLGDRVRVMDAILTPADTKALISRFDMLISGRIHAAVAGLSQAVPTVMIDYGHEPKAHKVRGFATVAGVEQFVADPASPDSMCAAVANCWSMRQQLRVELNRRMPEVAVDARRNFDLLAQVVG